MIYGFDFGTLFIWWLLPLVLVLAVLLLVVYLVKKILTRK